MENTRAVTPAQQRDQVYRWLTNEFRAIESMLDDQGKSELDGKLWALAQTLIDIGMWTGFAQALQDSKR